MFALATRPRLFRPRTYSAFRLAALFLSALLAAAPAMAERELRLTEPSGATSGTLMLQSDTPGKFHQAPLLATHVDIDISGPMARTRVTQRFENESDEWVEGIYVFPLPDESAVDRLRMQVGDRFIEGKIKEKQEARQVYEEARRQGRKASLLEQQRANIFTNSVANIGPGETVIVQIEYQQTVRIESGRFSIRFPMVVAPRYNPEPQVVLASIDAETGWAVSDPVPDRETISPPVLHPGLGPVNPVSMDISLDAGFPIGTLAAPFHDVTMQRQDRHVATLTLKEDSVPANRDFELVWTPEKGSRPKAALFTEKVQDKDYFLLMVTPPEAQAVAAVPAREVIFVVDTSGSMGGESIRQARQSLAMALQRLKPHDTFNVIAFNTSTRVLFPEPMPATEGALRRGLAWVEGLNASGGTEMLPALRTALGMGSRDNGRLTQVIFLTDGAIGNEQELFETMANRAGDTRIFTVGIGSAPNSYFMTRAAELGRGTFTHIGNVTQVAERMGDLFVKLETPVITDLQLDWPEGASVETSYTVMPDVYAGETLTVAAQSSADTGALTLSGQSGGQPWSVSLALEQASRREGISKLWARKKISALELDRARRTATPEKLDAEILSIALTHQLVSRLTSLVAVDITPSRPVGEALSARNIPLNLPDGWDFEKVFGEGELTGTPGPGHEARPGPQLPPPPARAVLPEARPVRLPQTTTLSEMKIGMGLLLLLIAALPAIFRRIP